MNFEELLNLVSLDKKPDIRIDSRLAKTGDIFIAVKGTIYDGHGFIDQAITKIVRMALAAEFGPSLVKSKGADRMVKTISAGIMSDPDLRKQALFILDRFAS